MDGSPSHPRTTEAPSGERSRFAHLPPGPDLDRAVAEHETRPDPTPDAEALAEFVERPGGRTGG